MKCPSCGKENPAGEQYCLDCGSDLSAQPAAAPASGAAGSAVTAGSGASAGSGAMSDAEFQRLLNTPAVKTCPHCGAPAPTTGNYCDSCGEPLTDAPAAAAAAPAAVADAQPDAATAGAPPEKQPETLPIEQPAAPAAPAPPATPAPGTVTLELGGPSSSGSFTMTDDEATIGRRDAEAGIYPDVDFDGNDIVTDGGERVHAVSRHHARIFREAGELKFEDSGSTNGSTLNGTAVLANDPQPIKDGDRIVLGRTCRITVHIA